MDVPFYLDWHFWVEAAVAIGTIAAALVAQKSVREVERTRKDDHLPVLIVTANEKFVPGKNLRVRLEIRNAGRGIAMHLQGEIHYSNRTAPVILMDNGTIPANETRSMVMIYEPEKQETAELHLVYQDIFQRYFRTILALVKDGDGIVIQNGGGVFVMDAKPTLLKMSDFSDQTK